ncbi:MAG: hypothetical protein K5683_10500 [Prevotella sp.]|nr:hypothetical protein [Prevotella sp.]
MTRQLTTTILLLFTTIMTGYLMTSCHDDSDDELPAPSGRWTVSRATLDDEEESSMQLLPYQASYESLKVNIDGRANGDSATVIVSCDADWLTLSSDTLASDGIISIRTYDNDNDQRRTATLTFTSADDPTQWATMEVTQASKADNATNGGDALAQLYVCYGYDIYKELESPMSVRTMQPILDYERLREKSYDGVYQTVTDCRISRTEMKYVATNSISAYGQNLSLQQTGDEENPIDGCRQDCVKAADLVNNAKGKLEQQNFGHGALVKAVAARVVDKGALIDLQRKGEIPYGSDFAEHLRKIRYKYTGEKRKQYIEQTLIEFGTHVIIEVDLGGRIDYTFTMSKEASFNTEEEMRQEIEYTLGRIADNERTTGNDNVTTGKSGAGAIIVKGGTDNARSILQNDINGLSPSGQIDPAHITNWLASINNSGNPENDPTLEVIHFELMPVWDIVPDDLRQEFLDATILMAQRSDCQLPASFLGTDIYEFKPQKEPMIFDFSNTTDKQTLCRLVYFDYNPKSNATFSVIGDSGDPVLEVCSEYVPKIRTDQRVTVAYPIYEQKIRMNQGLFLGDGIHQPAYVGFSGSNSYVNPIDSFPPGTYIEKFYYVNGSLQLKNPTNLTELKGRNRRIEDDVLTLYSSDSHGGVTHNHPIVKIGSQFWIRHDIDHQMYFAERPSGSSLDQITDNVLYTQFQWAPNQEFLDYNEWTWGYKPNNYFEGKPNSSWFLPTPAQVKELYSFIGFNPKALFRGQVSGFNAQFNGYYGFSDLKNQNRYFKDYERKVRYKNDINVISSNNSDNYEDACIMVINSDYSISMIDDKSNRNNFRYEWRQNYYPVRAVRGWMYNYPKYSTIIKNLR